MSALDQPDRSRGMEWCRSFFFFFQGTASRINSRSVRRDSFIKSKRQNLNVARSRVSALFDQPSTDHLLLFFLQQVDSFQSVSNTMRTFIYSTFGHKKADYNANFKCNDLLSDDHQGLHSIWNCIPGEQTFCQCLSSSLIGYIIRLLLILGGDAGNQKW
jgi:hypothetical protein